MTTEDDSIEDDRLAQQAGAEFALGCIEDCFPYELAESQMAAAHAIEIRSVRATLAVSEAELRTIRRLQGLEMESLRILYGRDGSGHTFVTTLPKP